ncbi:MAG: D-alanyl-D-alanine carboxypeptidase [Pyrinomonadaceae bacterium]|nr:D-alanyl-D-alanine carboxypeptidase [Pyrinomonadaceae bacterium]MCX7639020.1 D-alanyl-D-alanine carboxypeptidase [Pyrinomonadaceae bacterium]MDW8303760.1 D-alanyl-D-alanine carboxypeptidase [Acidobacteriota bacterium]
MKKTLIFFLLFGFIELAIAQSSPPPFLQPIKVQPTPTPLVKKTGSVTPANIPFSTNEALDVPSFVTEEIRFPGHTGILIETQDGRVVKEQNADVVFNPASNVKVATAYVALRWFGPEYRFPTFVFTDGKLDRENLRIEGNLYVMGRDPMFAFQHAVAIAEGLNQMGIREITGDLIVTDRFSMNFVSSAQASANFLLATLDASRRSPQATQAWIQHLRNSGRGNMLYVPSVFVAGKAHVSQVPTNARLLLTHESVPLREIIKFMMSFSHNWVAERLGDAVGGIYTITATVQRDVGVLPQEFYIQSSSGLGINRVTPRAMMKILRTLQAELARYRMTFADVMPVAGIDPGTLQNRFNDAYTVGSLVGKTGTLGNTDGGVSTLAGEIQTRNGGKMLFVIFNQRGSVASFRRLQDAYLKAIQNEFGGAIPLGYSSMGMAQRLARSNIYLNQ